MHCTHEMTCGGLLVATIKIRGGQRLVGSVQVNGAKNAVLPIIAASLLADKGITMIEGAPFLTDIENLAHVVRSLGVKVEMSPTGIVQIEADTLSTSEAPYELVRKMRASFWVAGPLLARTGHFRVPLPGGCNIGERPVDQHLKGFEALGATVSIEHGYVEGHVNGRLKGARVYLDIVSVGATINTMMAATLAQGQTIIENAAKEPEIVDLANYLNAMGASVRGAGTDVIRIEGVNSLHGASHTVIPDRIEAGTFMVAAAITGGDVFVEGAIYNHLSSLGAKLREAGVEVEDDISGIRVTARQPLKSIDVKTLPYPGFPTDLQAPVLALLTCVNGVSIITETLYENRFMHVAELRRMGADVKVEGHSAIVEGVAKLTGATVTASDLRAGAALVLAGLVAEGETIVSGIEHIDRGYHDLVGKLRSLGAQIYRTDDFAPPLRLVSSQS
jgi:UDP-N-acetylglucosamine 1-carboxyvinyltransferase